MLVMPTCTLERNRVGSAASCNARCAPVLPSSAICTSRTRRELTMAISDNAKRPFSRMRMKTSRRSVVMVGVRPRFARAVPIVPTVSADGHNHDHS
jgi:hypothetical protein